MAPIYIHIYIYPHIVHSFLFCYRNHAPSYDLFIYNIWSYSTYDARRGETFFPPGGKKVEVKSTNNPPLNTGPVLVQLCVGAEGIAGSARPRRPARAHLAPVHHRDPARRLPRPKARVRQAGVPDVRQAASDRHPAPHPRPPRCP